MVSAPVGAPRPAFLSQPVSLPRGGFFRVPGGHPVTAPDEKGVIAETYEQLPLPLDAPFDESGDGEPPEGADDGESRVPPDTPDH